MFYHTCNVKAYYNTFYRLSSEYNRLDLVRHNSSTTVVRRMKLSLNTFGSARQGLGEHFRTEFRVDSLRVKNPVWEFFNYNYVLVRN